MSTDNRPTIEGAAWLTLDLLEPSPTNPRKTFDQAALDELAASLRNHGQISPILARPNPHFTGSNGRAPYEIVAGERRWRAARLADLPSIMAIVRPLTDFDVLNLQVLENLQRSDLHPLEEAAGYEALLRSDHGLQGYANVDELAAKVGKSRAYIYGRLKLLELCDEARQAFLDGKLAATVAQLIARMPSAEQQRKATAEIVRGWGGEPFTFRAAAEYLKKSFMLELANAPFDVSATFDCAGPCHQCPKRSGANADLWADITKGDMCQDRACFEAKTEEHRQRRLQEAEAAGQTVITGDEARKVMPFSSYHPNHRRLDKPCLELETDEPLRDLLPDLKPEQILVVDHPSQEIVYELVEIELARRMLRERGWLDDDDQEEEDEDAPAKPAATGTRARPMSEREAEWMKEKRTEAYFIAAVADRVDHGLVVRGLGVDALRLVLEWILIEDLGLGHEGLEHLCRVLGWPAPGTASDWQATVAEALANADGQQLGEALILSAALALAESPGQRPEGLHRRLLALYGADREALLEVATQKAAAEVEEERRRREKTPEQALAEAVEGEEAEG